MEGIDKQTLFAYLVNHHIDIDVFKIYEASLTDIFVAKAGDEE